MCPPARSAELGEGRLRRTWRRSGRRPRAGGRGRRHERPSGPRTVRRPRTRRDRPSRGAAAILARGEYAAPTLPRTAAPRAVHGGEKEAASPAARRRRGHDCGRRRKATRTFDRVGGAERSRTADLLNAIQALSQLSYGPTAAVGMGGRRAPVKAAKARSPRAARAQVTSRSCRTASGSSFSRSYCARTKSSALLS